MSGPCLSSSVAGRPLRPATRHRLGEPLPHQLADRPRAHPEAAACATFSVPANRPVATFGINPPFGGLSQTPGQVAHVLRTLAPLTCHRIATTTNPFDLHVLSTPPAFVLSQNQTLRKEFASTRLRAEKFLTVHFLTRSRRKRRRSGQGSFSLYVHYIKLPQRLDV